MCAQDPRPPFLMLFSSSFCFFYQPPLRVCDVTIKTVSTHLFTPNSVYRTLTAYGAKTPLYIPLTFSLYVGCPATALVLSRKCRFLSAIDTKTFCSALFSFSLGFFFHAVSALWTGSMFFIRIRITAQNALSVSFAFRSVFLDAVTQFQFLTLSILTQ